VGWEFGKNGVLEHKSGNISEMRTDRGEETLLWGAYRKSPSLFRTVPSPTPYGLPFPKIGVPTPPKTPIAIISGTGKATNFILGQNNITGSIRTKAREKFWIKGSVGVSRDCPICSDTPYYLRNGKSYRFQIWPVRYIQSVHPNKSPLKILEKSKRGRIQGLPIFSGRPTPYYFRNEIQILHAYL